VLKGAARLTWPKPADAEAGDDGVVLGTEQLKAVVEPNHLPLSYTPAAGTRLPVGTHALHVHTEGDASFKGATLEVPFTVRAKTR
jgi:Cu/Zn superoxide dismutase